MIIFDYSQIGISNFMAEYTRRKPIEKDGKPNVPLLRHMILDSLRLSILKNREVYGNPVVLAVDHHKTWRKDVFPYYKANRKTYRASVPINWQSLFQAMDTIRDEIAEHFPYRVIQVEGAEGDDVIGALALNVTGDNVLIISADKDFVQLQDNARIKQWDPIRKRKIEHAAPKVFLNEMIIVGDRNDGIPNILSADHSLVSGRQSKMYTKKVDQWKLLPPEQFCTSDEILRNYNRNKTLIDLSHTPQNIKDEIINQYFDQQDKNNAKIFNYLFEHNLDKLRDLAHQF